MEPKQTLNAFFSAVYTRIISGLLNETSYVWDSSLDLWTTVTDVTYLKWYNNMEEGCSYCSDCDTFEEFLVSHSPETICLYLQEFGGEVKMCTPRIQSDDTVTHDLEVWINDNCLEFQAVWAFKNGTVKLMTVQYPCIESQRTCYVYGMDLMK